MVLMLRDYFLQDLFLNYFGQDFVYPSLFDPKIQKSKILVFFDRVVLSWRSLCEGLRWFWACCANLCCKEHVLLYYFLVFCVLFRLFFFVFFLSFSLFCCLFLFFALLFSCFFFLFCSFCFYYIFSFLRSRKR